MGMDVMHMQEGSGGGVGQCVLHKRNFSVSP